MGAGWGGGGRGGRGGVVEGEKREEGKEGNGLKECFISIYGLGCFCPLFLWWFTVLYPAFGGVEMYILFHWVFQSKDLLDYIARLVVSIMYLSCNVTKSVGIL